MLTEVDLRSRTGPVLSDGTAVRDLIDFDNREVSMRVLSDPELHRIELERVFFRHWVGIGHESEIPNVGDFVLRSIGEDLVIVVRDEDGEINILLNVCAHRGMEVCFADRGNETQFRCPYHAWVFGLNGELIGAPMERLMYGDWDKSRYKLMPARVAVRNGMIYGNLSPDGPSLEEHLGDLAWYHDRMFEGTEWEPLGPPMRMDIRSNWKAAADQNAGDIYHVLGAHRAASELAGQGADQMFVATLDLVKINFPEGHNLFAVGSGAKRRTADDPETIQDDRYEFEGASYSQLMFPANTGGGGPKGRGFEGSTNETPNGLTGMMGAGARTAQLGWYVPMGPGVHQINHLTLIDKEATEAQRDMARKGTMIGNAALIDDVDTWQSIQRAAEGAAGRKLTMKYPATQPINKPENWPGPGDVRAGFSRDDTHWYFWEAWFDAMTADEG